VAAIAGLADVDAITLSVTQVHGVSISAVEAALAIFVAASANSLTKTGIAFIAGTRDFGLRYGAATAVALAVAAAVLFAEVGLAV
jgi:uncharacterized membrane protein (DUF4010 family)